MIYFAAFGNAVGNEIQKRAPVGRSWAGCTFNDDVALVDTGEQLPARFPALRGELTVAVEVGKNRIG